MSKSLFAEAFGTQNRAQVRSDLPVIPSCVSLPKQEFLCECCKKEVHFLLVYYVKRYYNGKLKIESIYDEEIDGKKIGRYLFCWICFDRIRKFFNQTKESYEDIVHIHIEDLVKWSDGRIGKLFSMSGKEINSLHKNGEYRKKIWHWIRKTSGRYGIDNGGKK